MKTKNLIQKNCFILIASLLLAILIVPGKGLCREESQEKTGEVRFITIEGNTLRYVQEGEGKDVLLVHGLPGSIEDWDDIFGTLAERYRVTAFDRPGQGYSSEDNARATIEQNAETVIALIKNLKLCDVILVGHSYGGATILRVAIKDPDQVKAYVAIAAVGYPDAGPGFLFRIASVPFLGRLLACIAPPLIGKKMVTDGLRDAFYPNEEFLTEKIIESREKIWLQPKVVSIMAREHVNLNAGLEKSVPLYSKIKKPLYIIQGSDDKLVPAITAAKLHQAVKDSKLIMLEHTGHEVQFVDPEKVIKVIDEAAAGASP